MLSPTEKWKSIAGYEGLYEVSNLGRVRSMPRTEAFLKKSNGQIATLCVRQRKEKILKAGQRGGYLSVVLSKNGTTHNALVHRLVAQAFIPNSDNKPQVNHIEQPKTDNSVGNLEWATPAEDGQHRVAHDLRPNGSRLPQTKLTEEQVVEMRDFRAQGWLLRELSAKYDVAESTVSAVVRGRFWKQVVPLAGTKKPVQSVRLEKELERAFAKKE